MIRFKQKDRNYIYQQGDHIISVMYVSSQLRVLLDQVSCIKQGNDMWI